MTIHVFFLFPETAGKPLEEVTDMFEDPKGIKYIGTPAWRTKSQFKAVEKMEQGLDKKVHDEEEAPERLETVEPKLEV